MVEVFGHRGACGYLPENTIESFLLAFEQGAQAIEFDVVPTLDGELLLRHEGNLDLSTDIASRPEFADFKRDGVADGYQTNGWFVEDFDREALTPLRARERFSEWRQASAAFDGRFEVPTMRELLADSRFDGRHLIIEVKHGKHYQGLGLDPVAMLARDLTEARFSERGIRVTLESFDFEVCQQLRDAIAPAETMFLTMRARLPDGQTRPDAQLIAEVAREFDGLCVEVEMMFERAEGVHPFSERLWLLDFERPTALVAEIQAAGLKCYAFTARAEFAPGSVDDYHRALVHSGVQGIFSDQPDQLVKIVSELA